MLIALATIALPAWRDGSALQDKNKTRPLWSADMESGDLSQWSLNGGGGRYTSGRAEIQASNDIARSGSWSAKLTISTPHSPTSGARLFRWAETHGEQELYFSAWYYFPQRYSAPSWWNVFQWKSKVTEKPISARNDPFFIVNVGNRADGQMYFYLYDWQQRKSLHQEQMQIPVRQWTHLEARYRCAADNTGRVMVWQDSVLLVDLAGVPTRYAQGDCQWAVTNYSTDLKPTPATIYIDDASISVP